MKARFENLGGLTERAKVSMAGVTIGRVSKIYLDPPRVVCRGGGNGDQQIHEHHFRGQLGAILTAGLLG